MACSKDIELMKGALVRMYALTRHLPEEWAEPKSFMDRIRWFLVPSSLKKIVEQFNKEAQDLVAVKCSGG